MQYDSFNKQLLKLFHPICCCYSVAQSCLTLCDPMDCSTPGFPVFHCLPEFAQTHVHGVSDAVHPSHPLLSPSPPALSLSQHQDLSSELALRIRWPKHWSFSSSISPSNEYLNWFPLGWTSLISMQSKVLSRVFSSVRTQKHHCSINSIQIMA